MLISEVVSGHTASKDLEPSDDEIKRIRQDNEIKRKPNVRDMLFTDMPGNDSTYPAL
jgi:hypothetical protein